MVDGGEPPNIPNPFFSFSSSPSPYHGQGIWGSAIPASAGGTRPPNAFLCNSQPKHANLLNYYYFLPGTRDPALGAPGLCSPAHPIATPLNVVKQINIYVKFCANLVSLCDYCIVFLFFCIYFFVIIRW